MNEEARQALLDAAASSAMEGLPLSQHDMEIVEQIYTGKMTLADFIKSVQLRAQEA